MKFSSTALAAAVFTLACAVPALADKAGADKCAAGLGTEAKAIYVASAPGFAAAADPRAFITEKVKNLVMAGTVSMMSARPSAESAVTCLTQLR